MSVLFHSSHIYIYKYKCDFNKNKAVLSLDLLGKTGHSKQMVLKLSSKKFCLALAQGGLIAPVGRQEAVSVLLLCKTKSVVKKLWRRHLPRVTEFVSSLLVL